MSCRLHACLHAGGLGLFVARHRPAEAGSPQGNDSNSDSDSDSEGEGEGGHCEVPQRYHDIQQQQQQYSERYMNPCSTQLGVPPDEELFAIPRCDVCDAGCDLCMTFCATVCEFS